MPYSAEVIRRAQARLANAREEKESQVRSHLYQAYAQVPRLQEIDRLLSSSMAIAARAAFSQGEDAVKALEQVRIANLTLQQEREDLAKQHFPEGYLDDTPICHRCGGNGYIGSSMCTCLEQLCRQEQKQELGLLSGAKEGFQDFKLEYYSEVTDSAYGVSPRELMKRNLNICKRYAETFGAGSGNLLFVGNTGLGKTMLGGCIAAAVAEKGYSVAYESAGHLFAKLEKEKFNPSEEACAAAQRLRSSDLLIVDDLGTELPGNFVTAALYTLLNDRLLEGKATVVSTNLTIDEIKVRYSPQIASRLQGQYKLLLFLGQDIRVLKSRGV